MIKTTEDIIYNRCKNAVHFIRSKRFKKWFHDTYNYEMHHVFGSVSQKLKTTDYFSVPLTRQDHAVAEKDKSGAFVLLLPALLNVLEDYIQHLEKKLDRRKRTYETDT